MDKVNRIALKQLEEHLDDATHRSFNDLTKKDTSQKFSPIKDTLSFIMAISNTYALAWALFTPTSPLTIGLKELWQVIFDGLHSGDLQSIGTYQPDWYAHILWRLKTLYHYFTCYLNTYGI